MKMAPKRVNARGLSRTLKEFSMAKSICSADGCERVAILNGLCRPHDWRVKADRDRPDRRRQYQTLREALDAKTPTGAPDDCWEWGGSPGQDGYGVVSWGGSQYRAHRVSYELHVGPVPEGLVVRHACDNPPCVNPAHLLPGTQADNVRDMYERGRRSSSNQRGMK